MALLNRTVRSPKVAPYVLVLPFLITFSVFFLYPLLNSVQMSTLRFEGLTQTTFVGMDNFRALLNPRFFQSVRVTLTYTFWTIVVLVPLPLLLAVLLHSKLSIGAIFFKSVFFIPQLTSVIVAGLFFRFAFSNTETALLNTLVGLFGGEAVPWLRQSAPAMITMVTLATWRWFGVNLIYFLAGLQSITPELYEAAAIDGATPWQQFVHVTLPGLKATTTYVITISIFGGFSMFAESYALFGSARTPGDIASTMVGYIYANAFVEARMGHAAAAGMVLLGLVLLISVMVLILMGSFKQED